jgi:hypothetical protein
MIEAKVTFVGDLARQEVYEILTYLRGEGYWQFLCLNGTLKIIPESSIEMVEIINAQAPKVEKEEE